MIVNMFVVEFIPCFCFWF